MTRQELIQFIKESDPHYSAFTFHGHTYEDLVAIKQGIEKEKKRRTNNTI